MDEVLLRAIERLLAVIIGGLSVYLGYRLFLCIPEQKEGDGKIEFPGGTSIFVTRVGPGVFFAMFGAAIVGISLSRGIVASQPMAQGTQMYSGIAQRPAIAQAPNTLERLRVRSHIEFLNVLPTWVKADLPETERREMSIRTEEIKLLLMEKEWDQEWGDPKEFRRWVESGGPDPAPSGLTAAAQYFRAGQEGNP